MTRTQPTHKFPLSILLGVVLAAAPLAALADEVAPAAGAPAPVTPPAPEAPPAVTETPPAPPEVPVPPAMEKKKDEKSPITAKYDKGIVFESEDGEFEGKLSLRSQFRFETLRPGEKPSEFTTHIFIPRARLQLEGHVFGEDHRYKLEFAMGDKSGFAFVKDLWMEQGFSKGKMFLRVGQYKQPFNRQELVSDFGSEFNERPNTAEFVGGGRDVGVMLHNDFEKSPEGLEWAFGVFNTFIAGTDKPSGGSTSCTADPVTGAITCTTKGVGGGSSQADWGPTLVARVGFNKGKIKGYSEADLEGGPLRLAVAVSYKVDLGLSVDGAPAQHAVGVDFMAKASGLDVVGGVFMMRKGAPAGGSAKNEFGASVQGGYMVTPKHAQVGLRFSFIPNATDDSRKDLEMRAAYNYYFHGHQWKWSTDVGVLMTTGKDAMMVKDKADFNVRSMAQLTF